MRRFEFVQGTASKFWEVEQDGSDVKLRWGRIGTAGQSQTKSFADAAAAGAALTKLVTAKTGKGYQEVAAAPGTSATSDTASDAAPAANARNDSAASNRIVSTGAPTSPEVVQASDDSADAASPTGSDEDGTTAPTPTGLTATAGSTTGDRSTRAADSTTDRTAADLPPVPPATPAGSETWTGTEIAELPESLSSQVMASRRFPQPPGSTDPVALWDRANPPNQLGHLRVDLASPEWRAAAERAVLRLDKQPTPPEEDLEVETILLLLQRRTGGYTRDGISGPAVWVDLLVARFGLPTTVELYLRMLTLDCDIDHQNQREQTVTTEVTGEITGFNSPDHPVEVALRRHLSVAPQAQWAACAERMEATVDSLHPARRAAVALLLPDRPELSNRLLHDLSGPKAPTSLHWLQTIATDPEAIRLAQRIRPQWSDGVYGSRRWVATALQERGADAVAILRGGPEHAVAGEALTLIGTPDAISTLAGAAASSKAALSRLSTAVGQWPLAALVGLATTAAKGGKDVGLVSAVLTQLLLDRPDLAAPARPYLGTAAAGVVDRQLALLAGPGEVAGPDELPAVLVSPPWLGPAKKRVAALDLSPLPLPAVARPLTEPVAPNKVRIANLAAPLDRLLRGLGLASSPAVEVATVEAAETAIRNFDADELIRVWNQMMDERSRSRYSWFSFHVSSLLTLPDELIIPFWNAIATRTNTYGGLQKVHAAYGLAVLPALIDLLQSKPVETIDAALAVGAVELAPSAARAYATLKSVREQGREWLLTYPEHAACGLIAPALGKSGAARDAAGTALRLLATEGHQDLLLQVADRYDRDDVRAAVRAVLDESPLDRFPTKRQSLPSFWQPRAWRRPVTVDSGKALPDDALDHLGQMLTFPTTEGVYAGIDLAKQACTPSSLADFGWDLLTAWLGAGAPSKEGWALTGLARLGDDSTARALAPLIRAWPGEKSHARAVIGLDVLAGIGTDTALLQLNGIAQKVKFKGLQDKAREKIDDIAEARGLTTEELADRLTPDLGLDDRGTLLLDFGPRSFTVAFDESLKPFVREIDSATGRPGKRLTALPKPRQTDDPVQAKEATARFALLKKDARTIAGQQVQRLEAAMCTRRRWTRDVFDTFLAGHPLVRHLVQRLVWAVYDGTGSLVACFAVDGAPITADEEPFEFPDLDGLRIGLPHALELPADDAAAFGRLLVDYELVQPFAQLGRPIHTLDEAELRSDALTRWAAAPVPTGAVLGLVNKGWRRGAAQDGGGIWYFTKDTGDGRELVLDIDPGIIVGVVDAEPEQTLTAVRIGHRYRSGAGPAFDTLDAIAISELVRDLDGVIG